MDIIYYISAFPNLNRIKEKKTSTVKNIWRCVYLIPSWQILYIGLISLSQFTILFLCWQTESSKSNSRALTGINLLEICLRIYSVLSHENRHRVLMMVKI